MMEPQRIDLGALALPELTRERIARTVLARATALRPRGPLGVVGGWAGPGFAAAAGIAALSLGVLAWSPPGSVPERQPLTIADGLHLPAPAAEWISENRAPTTADLLASWEP
jgi:hypothetical protein